MTARSTSPRAFVIRLKIPGMLNVVSSRIALVMSVPMVTPTNGMTGALAAGTACRRMTRAGERPLPRAVRTKSS
jgi:hypothetical protein